ncbi:Uncharacterized protein ACO02O_00720 [Dirofilaria immitis]
MSNISALLCAKSCKNHIDNNSYPFLSTLPFTPATSLFSLPTPIPNQAYQINPSLEFIPFAYVKAQLPPEIFTNNVSQPQLYIPLISLQTMPESQRILQLLPVLPVQLSKNTSLNKEKKSNLTRQKMTQPEKRSKFGNTARKNKTYFDENARNMKDKEVADLLDAIEEFENETSQIHKPNPPIPIASLVIIADSKCNNNELRNILIQNIGEDLNTTKRMIQLKAEAKFGGHFNVICSRNNFSFLINTQLFCQATKGNVSCHAYRLLL